MRILKIQLVFLMIALSASNLVFADKIRNNVAVNFYTLAASDNDLDGNEIMIRGWIDFYVYPDSEKKVYLFPSKASMEYFNTSEAIEIIIREDYFDNAMEVLSGRFVTVYGVYRKIERELSREFGRIDDIEDINPIPR